MKSLKQYWIGGLLWLLVLSGCVGNQAIPASDEPIDTNTESVTPITDTSVLEEDMSMVGEGEAVVDPSETDDSVGDSVEKANVKEAVNTDLDEAEEEVVESISLSEEDYRSLQVNELGHIMVVMYHGIMDNPPYHRTKEDFLKDLTYFYEHGYRPIGMADYLSGHIDVEAGMTPIVFTFDDGLSTTFSLENVDGQLSVVPDTAVGLMESFAKQYPEFGAEASFYIHGNNANFKGDGTAKERLDWLLAHGYEIGNHSNTHANFSKLTGIQLLKEVGAVEVYLEGVLPDYKMTYMTYPFGARPDSSLIPLLYEGEYEGVQLMYNVAFREGPSGIFYPPTHVKFDAYNAPRVRGSEGEVQDLWWFLSYYEEHPDKRYISDGDPDTLVVPSGWAESISKEAKETFEIIEY